MVLAAELTDHSLAEIGRRFNRDHTTVMHALKAVQKRIQDDPEVGLDAEVLRERLAA
jgi:chromosomal replication initiator protein